MIKNKKFKNNKYNLILSAAVGYNWNDLKIFVKSLRKISNDRVIFIVDNNLDQTTKKQFILNNIEYFNFKEKLNLKIQNQEIAQRRYELYEYVLKNLDKKPRKILLTDSRDVVFQSNIFNNKFKKPLNFFFEKEKIQNDPRNARWLIRTVGIEEFEKIKKKNISCSGTTLGNFKEILEYTILMKKYIYHYPYKKPLRHILSFKKKDTGFDQGIHNYLLHNKFFKKKETHKNDSSMICTTAYMKKFNFNKKKQLINKNGKIYSIIHQYDRCYKKDGSLIFDFKKIYE